MLSLKNVLKTTEKMETSTRNVLKTDGNIASDKLDGFVVSKKVDLSLSLIDLGSNVAKVQCQVGRAECEFDNVRQTGRAECKFDNVRQTGLGQSADGSADMGQSADRSVCQQRGADKHSVCQQENKDDSVCQHKGGEGLVQKRAVWKHIGGDGHVWKQSVGRRADGVSVDDGNVIRQCVGLGDSDSVSGQRRGIGASMDVKGCDVLKLVSNIILRRETTARTPPSRMRSTGKTSTSPWRGVGAGSRTIGRTTATTQGSKGSSLTPQRIAAASKVGNLIAMHHGLIREQTNRGVEPDQWPASRYSREQGTNGSQGARPGSQ